MDYTKLRRTVNDLHGLVWDFRDDYAAEFPTPNPLTSLWFAETELGEARDAFIRCRTKGFNRASEKQRNLNHELCQALMMLLTAFPDYEPGGAETLGKANPSWISVYVSTAAALLNDGQILGLKGAASRGWEAFAWLAITGLVETIENPEDTMVEVLAGICHQRIEPIRMAKINQ